jgi:hypothetical protein
LIPLSWLARVIHPRPCRSSRVYTHQPSAWAPSGALWGWHAPMGPWDDGWRAFVRRRGRGWGPSLCLWLRVWIRKWLWLNFCVMWHGGYPFFFLYFLCRNIFFREHNTQSWMIPKPENVFLIVPFKSTLVPKDGVPTIWYCD